MSEVGTRECIWLLESDVQAQVAPAGRWTVLYVGTCECIWLLGSAAWAQVAAAGCWIVLCVGAGAGRGLVPAAGQCCV